jgi:sarcosine oxidase subunit alpha
MSDGRIKKHPILRIPKGKRIGFYWNKRGLQAHEGEVISSALFANGIHVFGHHAKDSSAQGIFCANGQCAQCMVIANGIPVKACMTRVQENMIVESVEGLPRLPEAVDEFQFASIEQIDTEVLIIGGGPAGLSAALELGERGIDTLIVDDKGRLGGKLVLQTHKFFGSIEDCYAGTRGIDIAALLEENVQAYPSIKVWLNSTAMYVFSDKKVGIVTDNTRYRIVNPKVVLTAAGAREKSLIFPGNTLPGVYGAGAFQTLVNRDLVKPAKRIFVVGGGNVGLIAAYHALQAGIDVVGVVEALPQCGGYQVHADKIRRLGVPIYTSHTIMSANGDEHVESITVCEIDGDFKGMPGTEKTYKCDTVLIAVGLSPVNEFFEEAKQAGIKVFAAGDAREIAEASSAMFSGKIVGYEIARELGAEERGIPGDWYKKAEILKSPPGPTEKPDYDSFPDQTVTPVFHCAQEIPCNPCVSVCPKGVISIPGGSLLGKPRIEKDGCVGCNKCVFICPGLAITLVDYREDPNNPVVSLAYELSNYEVKKGDTALLTDYEGNPLQEAEVIEVVVNKASRKTQIVKVRVPRGIEKKVAGFRVQGEEATLPVAKPTADRIPDDAVVCRCERVSAREIRRWIRKGIRDLNQIKAITRAGMGACGSKTCGDLILQLFKDEGVPIEEVTPHTIRPLFIEAPLGVFSNISYGGVDG